MPTMREFVAEIRRALGLPRAYLIAGHRGASIRVINAFATGIGATKARGARSRATPMTQRPPLAVDVRVVVPLMPGEDVDVDALRKMIESEIRRELDPYMFPSVVRTAISRVGNELEVYAYVEGGARYDMTPDKLRPIIERAIVKTIDKYRRKKRYPSPRFRILPIEKPGKQPPEKKPPIFEIPEKRWRTKPPIEIQPKLPPPEVPPRKVGGRIIIPITIPRPQPAPKKEVVEL